VAIMVNPFHFKAVARTEVHPRADDRGPEDPPLFLTQREERTALVWHRHRVGR